MKGHFVIYNRDSKCLKIDNPVSIVQPKCFKKKQAAILPSVIIYFFDSDLVLIIKG